MRLLLVSLQIASSAASCPLPEVSVRNVKTFEAFRKQFDSEELRPARLLGVTDKWKSTAWSTADLLKKLGDVEIWPQDLREGSYTSAARLSSLKIRQFFSGATSDKSVFETRFCEISRALETAHKVPVAFQTALYTMPIVGLSRNGTGVGFHVANSQGPWGSWVAQVHGSTTWALRPAGHKAQGEWPWPWRPALSKEVVSCTLQPGDALFVPSSYSRAWHGNDDANLIYGWQGPETGIPNLDVLLSAITKGDVQRLKNTYNSLSDSSGKESLLMPCVNHAIQTGHLPVLQFLHDKGVTFDEEDLSGFAPLHGAASQGQANSMLFALQRGADPKTRQKDGLYPIHMAAYSGHVDALNVLLSRREPGLKFKDRHGKQALHMSATQGHTAAASLLLAHRANVGARDGDGFHPLHWATERGQVPVLEVLLDARADIEARNKDGETPLYRAAIVGHVGALERLIERRALMDARSKAGRQAVHAAAYVGHLGILQALDVNGAEMSPKSAKGQYSPEGLAASAGHQQVLQFLQRSGAQKSKGTDQEKVITPGMSISAAVQAGHVPMLDSLLEKMPDRSGFEYQLNLANDSLRFGHVPILEFLTTKAGNRSQNAAILLLPFAATQGRSGPVEYLLRIRAEVNQPPPQGGDPPLLLAANEGHVSIVKVLLQHKANVDQKSAGHNITAMHLAVMKGKGSLVKTLLKGGAQMKIGDESGREHLHVAAAAGHKAVMGALLDGRADVMSKDAHGAPPIFLAAKEGHQVALRFLVERRADLSYKLKTGNDADQMEATVLTVAAAEGHIPALQFILRGHSVKQSKEIVGMLGNQFGKDWQKRFEQALELDKRAEMDRSWKDTIADPEKAQKMKEFSDIYKKLSPGEQRALDKKLRDQHELEEATKSHKERQKKSRVSRPVAEL